MVQGKRRNKGGIQLNDFQGTSAKIAAAAQSGMCVHVKCAQ